MLIKKFIAPNLPEALTKIKEDFGEDAVILKTRFNNKGTGLGKDARFVEVTAAVDQSEKRVEERPAPPKAIPPPSANRLAAALPKQAVGPEVRAEKQPPANQVKSPSEILTELRKDIAAIQSDLAARLKDSIFGQPIGMQLEAGRFLIRKHLPENLALEALKNIPPPPSGDPDQYWEALVNHLANLLGPGEPIKIVENGPTVVMLIGPTGGGKSSAAARLAFKFSMEEKAPVSLVTTDNFRADSREQLMALSNVIGCSFTAVSSPEELTVLLKTFKTGLVIIDTSGISTRSDIDELKALIGAANPHEIQMVVSADAPAGDITDFVRENPGIDVDRLFVTKLDQSRHRGGIIGAAVEGGLKFSYQSGSRELPGDIGLFDPKLFVTALKPGGQKGQQVGRQSPVSIEVNA